MAGAGRAFLESERGHLSRERTLLVIGLVAVAMLAAVLAAVFWPQVSSAVQDVTVGECVAREAGRFPNNVDALMEYCLEILASK